MGDFLDDYLDGLSSGQRFNPLPYGPYHGTKDKRAWHLMADGEREQAIFEARMREEESASSADAAAGADAGGSHISLTRQRARAGLSSQTQPLLTPEEVIEQATTTPTTPETFEQVNDYNAFETYGDLVDYETGEMIFEIPFMDETIDVEYQIQPVTDFSVIQSANTALTEERYDIMSGPPPSDIQWEANDTITSIASTEPTSVLLVGAHPSTQVVYGDYAYPGTGEMDTTTGLIYPIVAIGGDYAVQFRFVNLENSLFPLETAYVYPQIDATGYGGASIYWWGYEGDIYSEGGPPYSIFEIYIDPYLSPAATIEKIKNEYENFVQYSNNGVPLYSTHTAHLCAGDPNMTAWTYSVIKMT